MNDFQEIFTLSHGLERLSLRANVACSPHLHKNGPSLNPTEKTNFVCILGLSVANMIRECEFSGEACGKLGVYVCREGNAVKIAAIVKLLDRSHSLLVVA